MTLENAIQDMQKKLKSTIIELRYLRREVKVETNWNL